MPQPDNDPFSLFGIPPSLPPKQFGPVSYQGPEVPRSVPTVASTPTLGKEKFFAHDTPHNNSTPSPTKRTASESKLGHCHVRQPKKRSPSKAPSSRTKHTSSSVDTRSIRNDRLGTLVNSLCDAYSKAESWEAFVTEFRGRSYLAPELEQVDHPAIPLLTDWRDNGVPALNKSPPWSADQKDECIRRGCHKSATEHATFLREEFSEFIENKFWVVLPYDLVKDEPTLLLSAAAVKDERDRKPRLISDHSWDWGWPSVNDTTIHHAPPEAMQFGRALPRILQQVRHANPKFGPVRLCKHDIKDGFYRMFLAPKDCIRLTLVLPRYEGEEQLVAIPMSCTMGWVESPPSFSSMSETVCDRANERFRKLPYRCPPHRLEAAAEAGDDLDPSMVPRPKEAEDEAATHALLAVTSEAIIPEPEHLAPLSNKLYHRPVGSNDVFVDDFIQLGQGGRRRMKNLRQHLLHAIDEILAQPNLDEPHRNEAVSLKKLLKGDGSWATRKVILGWIIDTLRQTLELPAHRKETLAKIFTELAGCRRVSYKKWQKILGKLRFVSVAIPGSAALFCALQLALSKANGNRVRINRTLRAHIDTFAHLAASLCHRPTHLAEIVPQDPSLVGATDAAKAGMGGVFWDHTGRPFLWRVPFSPDVQARLVSTDNPTGSVTNSDLEHAGLIAQLEVQSTSHDTTYATICNLSDNTPAVSRVKKGAISSDGPGALLCGIACAHQRHHRYCHVASYIPGPANVMADDASRLQHLTDTALLSHFAQHYPQPLPWTLLHLNADFNFSLTSALLSKPRTRTLSPRPPKPAIASLANGSLSAPPSARVQPSVTSLTNWTRLDTSSSTPTVTACRTLSEVTQWIRPSLPSARGYPTWVNLIPEKRLMDPELSTLYSKLTSKLSATKTILPPEPTLSTLSSCEASLQPSTQPIASTAPSTPMPSTSSSPPSSGCSALPNTWRPTLPRHALKPSASATSPSTPMVA